VKCEDLLPDELADTINAALLLNITQIQLLAKKQMSKQQQRFQKSKAVYLAAHGVGHNHLRAGGVEVGVLHCVCRRGALALVHGKQVAEQIQRRWLCPRVSQTEVGGRARSHAPQMSLQDS
jgi:hypothetical protein